MRFAPGKPLLRISWKWNKALNTNSFISFRGTSHGYKCPILALPFWTLILSFFITFFHVCIFHLLCSCLTKVWSKFLVKLTTLIKNALGLKDNGTSALLLDDTMFAISFDLYCGTVNSRGKKKKKNERKRNCLDSTHWTLRRKTTQFSNITIISSSQQLTRNR